MNADQVRAFVAATWPDAMRSPLAQAVQGFCAADEADRAVGFAKLQASATVAEAKAMRAEALEHARHCIETCDAQGIRYDADTLSMNIESAFPDLDMDVCDEVAEEAVARWGRRA
jgi:hypothetical protein